MKEVNVLQAGDTIEDVTVVNSEWLEGRLRSAKGIFPASFVKIMDSVEAERRGLGGRSSASTSASPAGATSDTTALYDFHAEMPTDLPLKEGQTVTVTAMIEGGQWLLGHSGGRTGQFPANFVAFVPPNLPVVTL
ncbi:SH3 domain [Trinorchestia longiramus]|nr:SH3 domain [Trinorchestia longiramus]